ncbi:MAG: mechanosensitive ion channel family protein [Bifidobacteriaceae bacterium]|jgi:small conductance mechanosensitive channel|nr:mechanosensitive ion channel family protein [Bifidobacteriaceae bacterium]
MTVIAAPEFASTWPKWAQFLMGAPLRIAVVLVCAVIVAAVAKGLIRRAANRLAAGAGRTPGLGSAAASGLGLGLTPEQAEQAAARRASRFKTLGSVLTSVVGVVVWVLAVCLVLEALGVNAGLIIASLGTVGVAVGLGAQTLVKDVVAGFFILVEDQYGLGDEIDAGDATGVVVSMSLRVTTLRDASGETWYVPNGSIARVGNKSQVGTGTNSGTTGEGSAA